MGATTGVYFACCSKSLAVHGGSKALNYMIDFQDSSLCLFSICTGLIGSYIETFCGKLKELSR